MTPTEQRLAAELAAHYARKAHGVEHFRPMPIAAALSQLRAGGLADDLRQVLDRAGVKVMGPHRIEFDVERLAASVGRRDLVAGTAGAGGYLVGTDVPGPERALAPVSATVAAGARYLPGLVGNVMVPRVAAAATRYWLSTEGTATTESQQTLGAVALTLKTVGTYIETSRQLSLQAPSLAQMIDADLFAVIGAAVDAGALAGTGLSGQPTGLVNTAGIGTVSGASIDWSDILEMRRLVRAANGREGTTAWVMAPDVAKLLGAREKATGSGFILDAGMIDGRPVFVSNNCPTATLICGDFDQLVIGQWGGAVVEWDPRANFAVGIRGARLLLSVDVGLITPAAFAVASSVT